MNNELKEVFYNLGISDSTLEAVSKAESLLSPVFNEMNDIAQCCHYRILAAFQKHRLSDMHFGWNTGYGYDDVGRETVEKIYADVFGGEDAIVRPTIVNGTHALTLSLWGALRPGDTILSVSGKPYDTLDAVIGLGDANKDNSSLIDYGIKYEQVELLEDGRFDYKGIGEKVKVIKPRMVYIQRSAGYSWRAALRVGDLEILIKSVKEMDPSILVMVDNCYGEFLETKEPCHVGADIIAGSLIKNPGGGMAVSGGYIVGKEDILRRIAGRMTSPEIGKECGLTFGLNRSILHGLFVAPGVVAGALKGAVLCAGLFEQLGYEVCPASKGKRSDIIQAVKLGSPEKVIAFCQAIQSAAPVDSFVTPLPWEMPGYTSEVIMAAGAFVQGSSIELSADAPLREPYIVYFQGGLTYEHSKLGAMKAYDAVVKIQ